MLAYPLLVATGLSPLAANVTNTVGSVTGSLTGALGYRLELAGQRRRVLGLLPACAVGAVVGVTLLLALPAAVFPRVVPWLVLAACLLVAAGPWVRGHLGGGAGGRWLPLGVFVCAVYGGYFGAANSVLVLSFAGSVVHSVGRARAGTVAERDLETGVDEPAAGVPARTWPRFRLRRPLLSL